MVGTRSAGLRLTNPELNRALLARQLLLRRHKMPLAAAVEHLVGMQAQDPRDPYLGLWSRLADFDPEQLSRKVAAGSVVRVSLMRSTIHLVTAKDCARLRPLVQPVHERMLRGSFGRHLVGLDLEAVATEGRTLLGNTPMTFAELGERLTERWPERNAQALAQTVRALVPLTQVPPRGLWGKSAAARHAPARLGGEPSKPDTRIAVTRYLAAFGPASVMDFQAWSGLTKMKEVFQKLKPRLQLFAAPDGTELFDLPDAPRPGGDAPAPVRFLPQYDNLFLGHADRRRLGTDVYMGRAVSENAAIRHFMVDGLLAGTWGVTAKGPKTALSVKPFYRLPSRSRDDVEAEGLRLLAFLEPEAEQRDVRLLAVRPGLIHSTPGPTELGACVMREGGRE